MSAFLSSIHRHFLILILVILVILAILAILA
jgi:hypothetical protein